MVAERGFEKKVTTLNEWFVINIEDKIPVRNMLIISFQYNIESVYFFYSNTVYINTCLFLIIPTCFKTLSYKPIERNRLLQAGVTN
jgi:hypothetical protein